MDSSVEDNEELLKFKPDLSDPVQRAPTAAAGEGEDVAEKLKAYPKKAKPISQHDKLQRELIDLLERYAIDWSQELAGDLPKKWKIVAHDLLILPASCFTLPAWKLPADEEKALWTTVAACFRVSRVAQENRVKPDDYRTPSLNLLFGSDPVVVVNNNGVK